MRKKDYVQSVKTAILNRIRFHAPIVYDSNLDRRAIFDYGIDINKPVFKFDKILTKPLIKAFNLAGQEECFNLVVSTESLVKNKDLDKLKNAIVFNPTTCKASVLEGINKLNINYPASTNYDVKFKDKFVKVQNQVLNPHYDDFSLEQILVCDDVLIQYKEFVLNGNNYYIRFQNKATQNRKISLEINIPFEKGYYYFKRLNKCVSIENLLTKEKRYLNYICRGVKYKFSEVDGLENSVYCCINAQITLNLTPNENSFVYFNLGDGVLNLKGEKEILRLKELAYIKCCEIFNLKIKTKNPNFDTFFNKTLPQKIWINWANGVSEQILEEKYLALKRLFVKGDKELSFVRFKEIGVRELGIFNGKYYKKILIVNSKDNFLRIGKTFFYNINTLNRKSLQTNEPFILSYGER